MRYLDSPPVLALTGYSLSRQAEALAEWERGVYAALETYSNVHRGSGHHSMASTRLFEHARDIVLEYQGLSKDKYVVIFCTARLAETLAAQLKPASFKSVSSQDIGLPLGVRAVAVEKEALPTGVPFQTGGGTVKIVSPLWPRSWQSRGEWAFAAVVFARIFWSSTCSRYSLSEPGGLTGV